MTEPETKKLKHRSYDLGGGGATLYPPPAFPEWGNKPHDNEDEDDKGDEKCTGKEEENCFGIGEGDEDEESFKPPSQVEILRIVQKKDSETIRSQQDKICSLEARNVDLESQLRRVREDLQQERARNNRANNRENNEQGNTEENPVVIAD